MSRQGLRLYILCLLLNKLHALCGDVRPITNGNRQTLVCPKTCGTCNLRCDSKGLCMDNPVEFYCAADTCNVYCSAKDSCQQSNFYIGDTGSYPNGSTANDFGPNKVFTSALIECSGGVSCKQTSFTIKGNYPNGIQMNALSNGVDTFANSNLEVELNENQMFVLDCGTSSSSCDGTSFDCFGGICDCNGAGCTGLIGGVNISSSVSMLYIYIYRSVSILYIKIYVLFI